jgi:hypothetical protein
MNYDLTPIMNLFNNIYGLYIESHKKQGRPYTYSQISMLYFFVSMMLKGINTFKGMAEYIAIHYKEYSFNSPPSRKTISRRFKALGTFLEFFIPFISENIKTLDYRFYAQEVAYIDKSNFWTGGGLWHSKQKKEGVFPPVQFDKEATWTFSKFQQWVFGYGLHLIVNRNKLPLAVTVETASIKETSQIAKLLQSLLITPLLLVADNGYRDIKYIEDTFNNFDCFLLIPKPYKTHSLIKDNYSDIVKTKVAKFVNSRRKFTIEPVFSLIKQLFNLKKKSKLPYDNLIKNRSFIMITVFTIQFLMIFNSIYQLNLYKLNIFKSVMI